MQTVCFPKTEYPNGKLKNAQRYSCSVAEGNILGVALIGVLTEKDEENWQAPRVELSALLPATADNAVQLFQQAATGMGGYAINETYIRSLFEED